MGDQDAYAVNGKERPRRIPVDMAWHDTSLVDGRYQGLLQGAGAVLVRCLSRRDSVHGIRAAEEQLERVQRRQGRTHQYGLPDLERG